MVEVERLCARRLPRYRDNTSVSIFSVSIYLTRLPLETSSWRCAVRELPFCESGPALCGVHLTLHGFSPVLPFFRPIVRGPKAAGHTLTYEHCDCAVRSCLLPTESGLENSAYDTLLGFSMLQIRSAGVWSYW